MRAVRSAANLLGRSPMKRTLVGMAIGACVATAATAAIAHAVPEHSTHGKPTEASPGRSPDIAAGAGTQVTPQATPQSAPQLITAVPGPAATDLRDSSPVEDVIPPVAERIFELGSGRGFVSQQTDYLGRSIAVVWHGDVPSEVRDYVASKPYGVTVTISAGARYSREAGNAARSRILANSIAQEIGIVSTSVNQDGSGLTLGITSTTVTTAQRNRLSEVSGLRVEEITINGGLKAHDGYAVL